MKRLAVAGIAGLFIALLLGSVAAAFAAARFDVVVFDVVVFDVVVEDGEVINNEIVLFGENLEIRAGAVVNSDVTMFDGDARIAGEVNGDVALFNGDLEVTGETEINGDCVLLNGVLKETLTVPGGATVHCTTVENAKLSGFLGALTNRFAPPALDVPPVPTIPPLPTMPAMPTIPPVPGLAERPALPHVPAVPPGAYFERGFGGGDLLAALAGAIVLGMLGAMTAVVMPRHLGQIQTAVRHKPAASGAIGVLTAIAVPSLIVLLIPVSALLTLVCIGLLGFPIILALAIGLVAALFIGWIAMGTTLGQWLLSRRKDRPVRLPVAAGVGTALLTFLFSLLGALPFTFGVVLLAFVVASVGLGAVTLTQFGRKPYPVASGSTPAGTGEDEDKVRVVLQTLPDEG
jgi:hypothetical protein